MTLAASFPQAQTIFIDGGHCIGQSFLIEGSDMAMLRTFAEIAGPLGLDRRSVDNWLARLVMHTAYEPTRQGAARRFTRDNAVELAMLAALTSIGLEVSRASAYAGALLRHRFQDGGAHEYLTFTNLDGSRAVASNKAPALGATLRGLPDGDAVAVRVIGQGEILRRVARLFDEPRSAADAHSPTV